MYLDAHISVYIGVDGRQTSGNPNGYTPIRDVVSVRIENDCQHIGASCDIVLPLNARIEYTDGKKDYLTAASISTFQSGDPILVKAKYDGYESESEADENGFITVFEGFLYDFYEGNPLKIVCQDWVFKLNQKAISISYPDKKGNPSSISMQNFINDILDNTGVAMLPIESEYYRPDGTKVTNPTFNLMLQDIHFTLMTPAAILNWIKKEIGINITLMRDKLYVNVASNTTSTVKFDTRYNVKTSDLQTTNLTRGKKAQSVFLKLKLKAWFIQTNGTKDSIDNVGDPDGQLREVYFYNIPRDQTKYKQLAAEALEKFKQRRFNGTITTYLYPYCDLFWRVEYRDYRYPEKNGIYVITSITTDLDENGYKRELKLSYLADLTT